MDFHRIYSGAVNKSRVVDQLAKPLEDPTENQLQFVITDDFKQWLESPFTKSLFNYLKSERERLLEFCVENRNSPIVGQVLAQVSTIEQTHKYATRDNRNARS